MEKRVAFWVDNILQQQEVVIKPFGKFVDRFDHPAVNGATIMGNGQLEMILNTGFLMDEARKKLL